MTRSSLLGAAMAGLLLIGAALGAGGPDAVAASAVPHRAALIDSAVIGSRIIGHTVQGRPIRAWRLGQASAATKVVLIATMHGDESGPAKLLFALRDGAPITGADIWIVPYLNRDGLAHHTRRNAHGVDLNRNFPVGWVRQYGPYYSGPGPASEPETRSLMRFLGKIRPRFVVSMHQPLFGVDTSYGKARGLALRLSRFLELPEKVFNCNTACHGTMTEWFNRRQPGAALTVEYGSRMTTRQLRLGPDGLLAAVGATR